MKKQRSIGGSIISIILTLICSIPFVYVAGKSFLKLEGGFTLDYYYQVLLATAQFLLRFWKSLGLTMIIAVGQVIVSALAGYAFAKCRFPGKNWIFFLLMILMVMPLQVTLVPNYIVLDAMKLLDTYYALVLPMIFVPLGTFIMTQSYKSIPDEIIEAARLDGCTTTQILTKVAIPMNKSGLVCTFLLSFLDGWNMVEQPIVYIRDFERYPISVALASVPPEDPTIQLVCCMLVVLPPMFLFAFFNRELVEGIVFGKEK